MIDTTESMARLTVTFDREFTGQELIDATRSICDRYAENDPNKQNNDRAPSHDRYFEQRRYDDRLLVTPGRTSADLDRTLVVVADRTTPFLEPDKTYRSVVIAHDEAPLRGNTARTPARFENVVRSVQQFGEDLRQELRADRGEGPDRALAPAAGAVATRPQRDAAGAQTSAANHRVPHRAPSADTATGNRYWGD